MGSTENNYLYTGEQFDPNVGFYYLRARYYNPEIGRFTTVDPWKGSIYDPVSLHKYIYCNNDPVNFVDWGGEMSALGLTITVMVIITIYTAVVRFILNNSKDGGRSIDWDNINWKKTINDLLLDVGIAIAVILISSIFGLSAGMLLLIYLAYNIYWLGIILVHTSTDYLYYHLIFFDLLSEIKLDSYMHYS